MRFLHAGDSALIVEFGSEIDQKTLARVSALNERITRLIDNGELTGVIETVPTFRSLALLLDPLLTSPDDIAEQLADLSLSDESKPGSIRQWQLPVHYGDDGGPDLPDLASATGLSEQQIISRHQSTVYTVYMLGFQPGFGFMGDVHASIRQPRRRQPRTRVPAGTVAIANQLTAIYPWESPGGWHLIGRCPVPLFDAGEDPPALFRSGDTIHFRSIDVAEYDSLADRSRRKHIDRAELVLDVDAQEPPPELT